MEHVQIEQFYGNDRNTVVFLALINNESIGRAELIINNEHAFLKDISVTQTESGWFWFPPFYKKGINYRGNGIGTSLLEKVFTHCESLGVKELTGVMRGDLELLTRWYQKHGFEVLEDQKICRYFST